jgi:hypothetical protein
VIRFGDLDLAILDEAAVWHDERIGDRLRRRDLIGVPVLEGGEDLTHQVEHVRLVIDDQDSLHGLRVDRRLPFRGGRRPLLGSVVV